MGLRFFNHRVLGLPPFTLITGQLPNLPIANNEQTLLLPDPLEADFE